MASIDCLTKEELSTIKIRNRELSYRYKTAPIVPEGRCKASPRALLIRTDARHIYLLSYNTIVCGVVNGEFQRYWGGYSSTTLKQVNAFCNILGVEKRFNKKEWELYKLSKTDFTI